MTPVRLVRRVDELGRLVVPAEIRRQLNVNVGDGLEVLVDGEDLVLRKWEPPCVLCGATGDLEVFMGKRLCQDCTAGLSLLAATKGGV